jgi:hypothetical protein
LFNTEFNQKTAADKEHEYEYAELFKQAFDSGLLHMPFITCFSNNSWLAIHWWTEEFPLIEFYNSCC